MECQPLPRRSPESAPVRVLRGCRCPQHRRVERRARRQRSVAVLEALVPGRSAGDGLRPAARGGDGHRGAGRQKRRIPGSPMSPSRSPRGSAQNCSLPSPVPVLLPPTPRSPTPAPRSGGAGRSGRGDQNKQKTGLLAGPPPLGEAVHGVSPWFRGASPCQQPLGAGERPLLPALPGDSLPPRSFLRRFLLSPAVLLRDRTGRVR